MNQARTKAYLQSQWNIIEKQMLAQLDTALVDAMESRAADVLDDFRNLNSYQRDTGNLDASIGMAMYANKGNVRKMKWMVDDEGDGARKVKSDISIPTRYGTTIKLAKGSTITGRESTEKAEAEYNQIRDKRIRTEMVIFGEMYYRYFLENMNSGKNNLYVQSFVDYEKDQNQHLMDYWKEIQLKMKIGKAMAKNIAKFK